jgi:Fe-S-cluster containining protein
MNRLFDCLVCGKCCRSIGKLVVGVIATLDHAEQTGEEIHPILIEISEFPYDINPDGSCSKLSGDICSVYENRPFVCRVDSMYEKYWSKIMSRDDWYAESRKSCTKLQEGKHDNH